MKTICLACVVYTLKGKDPKDNLYLNIFYQWLTMVIKHGGLKFGDMLHIHMDDETIKYLDIYSTVFHDILPQIQCDFEIHRFEQPDTPLKGMMHKYVFTEYKQDAYIYSDIDIIIINPFRNIIDKAEYNTMYFTVGTTLDHQFYSEGFPKEIPVSDKLPGFNASNFIIIGKHLRDAFFSRIHELCDYSTKYKWVEQPYFNRAIYDIPRDIVSVDIKLLTEHVSFNGHLLQDNKTVFYDLAGETSDGLSHLIKMSDVLCKYSLK